MALIGRLCNRYSTLLRRVGASKAHGRWGSGLYCFRCKGLAMLRAAMGSGLCVCATMPAIGRIAAGGLDATYWKSPLRIEHRKLRALIPRPLANAVCHYVFDWGWVVSLLTGSDLVFMMQARQLQPLFGVVIFLAGSDRFLALQSQLWCCNFPNWL